MLFENSILFARDLDTRDPLKNFREQFYFPMISGKEVIYFNGNSLGLQPKNTQNYILKELEDWATFGVEGHFHARMPWFTYQDFLTGQIAELLGAKPIDLLQ